MKTRKKVITVISVLFLLSLAVSLIACSTDSNNCDITVNVSLRNISETKTVTLYIKNIDTGREFKVKLQEKDKYTCSLPIDYGEYSIEKIKVNGIDSKVEIDTAGFKITEDVTDVLIDVIETDVTGTPLWYLRKNAFTLTGLIVSCIALIVVRERKKRVVSTDRQMQ